MSNIKLGNFILAAALAIGLGGFATTAHAAQYFSQNYSMSTVRHAQRRLRADGYYRGRIDGISGPNTHAAVRQFQRDHNLAASGRLNDRTLRRLGVTGFFHRNNQSAFNNRHERRMRGEASRSERVFNNGTANRSSEERHNGAGNYNGRANQHENNGNGRH
jgi:peptidoglycan hydrolase-like protein with peptidoglycan-binding domain